MSTRATVSGIKAICETTLENDEIEQFIADANIWVSEELTNVTHRRTPLSAERLEIIERYLACALIRIRDQELVSAGVGQDISEKYQIDPSVTEYLTRAASMDPTGKVRQAFLAPKNVRRMVFRVGRGFVCETGTRYRLGSWLFR